MKLDSLEVSSLIVLVGFRDIILSDEEAEIIASKDIEEWDKELLAKVANELNYVLSTRNSRS